MAACARGASMMGCCHRSGHVILACPFYVLSAQPALQCSSSLPAVPDAPVVDTPVLSILFMVAVVMMVVSPGPPIAPVVGVAPRVGLSIHHLWFSNSRRAIKPSNRLAIQIAFSSTSMRQCVSYGNHLLSTRRGYSVDGRSQRPQVSFRRCALSLGSRWLCEHPR